MLIEQTESGILLDVFPVERERLTRLLTRLCGDRYTAEDLAQETLTEAWLNRHKLTKPEGYQKWLTAIAYNIYRRWRHKQHQETTRYVSVEDPFELDRDTQDTPLEIALEQQELATLLDKAIALLPPETQAALIAHYLEGQPQARVAEQLNTTKNAIAVRLHRGKLTLRQLLASELERQTDGNWQETRIWCTQCGHRRLLGLFHPTTQEFALRCPDCDIYKEYPAFANSNSKTSLLKGVKGFKPALNRLLQYINHYYPQVSKHGVMRCLTCGKQIPIQFHFPSHWPEPYGNKLGIYSRCDCGMENYTSLYGIAIATKAGQQFLKQHPRSLQSPIRQINYQGYPALLISFKCLKTTAYLDVIFAENNYQQLGSYTHA